MNIFRLAGDMTHLMSVVVLLLKIHATRSCRGASQVCFERYFVSSSIDFTVAGMCRNLVEDAGALCTCIPDQIHRSILQICVTVSLLRSQLSRQAQLLAAINS